MRRPRRYFLSTILMFAAGGTIVAAAEYPDPAPADVGDATSAMTAAEWSSASSSARSASLNRDPGARLERNSRSEVETMLAQGGPPPGRGPGRGAIRGQGRGRGRGGFGPDPQFAEDRDGFHFLLSNHEKIQRQVKLLDNGVDTVTESDDPAIADAIRQHVKAMYQRVEQVRPIHTRDPLFAAVFQHAQQIELRMEPTEKGIHVTETSQNPYTARLIQAHAAVVDGFVRRGFAEAQENHTVPAAEREGTASTPSPTIDVQQAFAAFDQAYIPALALTNQGQQQASERAMERLRKAWTDLTEQLDAVLQDDPAWPGDRQAVRDVIGAAARELSATRPAAAHAVLEELRGRLSGLRQRNQWTYDLDALNTFHETMEKMVQPAMEITAADVNDLAQRDLRKLLQTAQQQWSVVEEVQFSRAARNMDEAAYGKLQNLVQLQRQALSRLETALDAGDAEQILQAARGIKPAFAQLYMSFGDFPEPAP